MRLARPLIVLSAALAAAPATAHAAPAARAQLDGCDLAARVAAFSADMRAVEGAQRLQLKFVLQRRDGDGPWVRLDAPTFGRWSSAAPGRTRYVYDKRVENLGPGAYRVVVRFRWRAAGGEVLRRATRRSAACEVPDLRADLVPVSLDVRSSPADGARAYVLTVANRGRTTAPPTVAALRVDGQPVPDREVPAIAAGEEVTVVFTGPPCRSGGTLVSTVDATGLVDEAVEADDTLSVPCRATESTPPRSLSSFRP